MSSSPAMATAAPTLTPPTNGVKRVLIVSSGYHGAGGHRCPRELAHELVARGIDVTMFVPRRAGDEPSFVRTLRFGGEQYLKVAEWIARGPVDWRHVGSRWRLGRIREGDFDLVHLHNLHEGFISLKSVADLSRRIPTVWTLHDEYALVPGLAYDLNRVMSSEQIQRLWPDLSYMLDSTSTWARRRAADFARHPPKPAAIISPSQYLARLAQQNPRYHDVPVHQIPYGLSMLERPERHISREQSRAHFGLDPNGKVLLLIAAHLGSPYKGMGLAVEALRKLSGKSIQILALGPMGEQIVQGLPAAKVVAPGWVNDDAVVAKAYRAADFTLIPSVADNFPYVALESLACATPLVAFRIGGLDEMIGNDERGLAARPFDTDELAANMRALFDDSDRARSLGEAGREWVEQHCSMRKFIDASINVYQTVARTHREALA